MIYESIDSPFTKGPAHLERKINRFTFRKSDFEITEHYYLCETSNEEFTTSELDALNLNQVYNQYRDRYGLPFPDQIKRIRSKYGVSALKMSEILGLGANSYRLYEQGEVPSVGNGRLIMAAENPQEFDQFLKASEELIDPKEFKKIKKRVDELLEQQEVNHYYDKTIKELFNKIVPDQYTGYRMPSLEKISHMIIFFSDNANTWKTKLNKLLFYSDFLAFKNTGYGITGLDYRAIKYGPVPANYDKLYDEIAKGEFLNRVHTEERDYEGSFFIPQLTFDESLFEISELSIINEVIKKFKWHSASEIKEVSHNELAWKGNYEEKNIISYKDYAFVLKSF
ncbi:MAG: type II toxin-antitoxin system antitoxin SocA domain-containing protein [Bacteroidota bacterium]